MKLTLKSANITSSLDNIKASSELAMTLMRRNLNPFRKQS